MNGSKSYTEAMEATNLRVCVLVGERCRSDQAVPKGAVAGPTGDYAGMSNDKAGENPARRKPKVSWGRQFRPGLAGTLVEAERRRRWTAG